MITVTLMPEARPGRYTLACGPLTYAIQLRPDIDVALGDLLRRLQPVLVGAPDPSGQSTSPELLRATGERIWRALLPDTAPAEMRTELAKTLYHGDDPLGLFLPPDLAVLPWEALCDPTQLQFGPVALRRPLVRLIAGESDRAPLAPPLRVLLLISSPPRLQVGRQVDVESERAMVEAATRPLREQGLLHLQVEDIVTQRRVQQALLRFKPHLLHYIGHGGYVDGLGGILEWEDEQGQPMGLTERQLVGLLRSRGLRAVLLHGCETAASDRQTDFRGVAGALMEAGIPAVLAQQAKFTYESSQRAGEMFYTALGAGGGMAEAVFEARQALSQANRPDWAVPVLYAVSTGLDPLLDASAPPAEADPRLAPPRAARDLPAPTGVFVGRQRELRALRQMLESPPGSGPVMALVTGPGGVGKSSLVAQAVARYAASYKAALTLSCRGYQGVDLFLQRLSESMQEEQPQLLGAILPDPKLSLETKIREVVAALEATGPFVLILDNLESAQATDRTLADAGLRLMLRILLTNLRSGRMLVTGRYAVEGLLPEDKFSAHLLRIQLDDLHPVEIRRLLDRHPGLAHLDAATREEVLREFGGLPYVYDLLNSVEARQSLAELIRDVYGRITAEHKKRTVAEWAEVRRQVVGSAALEGTVARLTGPSRTLLGRLCVFSRPFPLEAMEHGLGSVREAWEPLVDWALLRHDATHSTYHLHSITARYAADHLLDESERATAQMRAAEWYLQYAEVSHDLSDALEAHRLFREAGAKERAGELVLSLGNTLSRFGLYDLQRTLCQQTLDDNEGGIAANALHELGIIAQEQGKYAEARRLYGEARVVYERLGDQRGWAAILHQMGNISYLQGDYDEARQLYREALPAFERLGDQGARAVTLRQLGTLAKNQGEYDEARRLYREALPVFERLGDQSSQAGTLQELGMIAQEQGEYTEARRFYGESLALTERLGDQRGRAGALHQLGVIAQEQGDYAEARRLHGESLALKERLGDQHGRAGTLHSLGMIAHEQGEYVEARRFYGESLALTERLGDQDYRAGALHQLGMIAKEQGEYTEARRLYGESLALKERLGDQRGRAFTLRELGTLAHVQGNYAEARRLYGESLALKERLGDQRGRANTLHQVAMIAHEQGEYAEARRLYGESLALTERLGDQRGHAFTLAQLSLLAQQQRDYAAALRFMWEALQIFERLHLPQREQAMKQLAEIRRVISKEGPGFSWRVVASVQHRHQPVKQIVASRRVTCGDALSFSWRAIGGAQPAPEWSSVDRNQERNEGTRSQPRGSAAGGRPAPLLNRLFGWLRGGERSRDPADGGGNSDRKEGRTWPRARSR